MHFHNNLHDFTSLLIRFLPKHDQFNQTQLLFQISKLYKSMQNNLLILRTVLLLFLIVSQDHYISEILVICHKRRIKIVQLSLLYKRGLLMRANPYLFFNFFIHNIMENQLIWKNLFWIITTTFLIAPPYLERENQVKPKEL